MDIAGKYGVSPAQVVLRGHLRIGNVVIPKSVNPEQTRHNLDVFGFELSGHDIAAITGLDAGTRTGPGTLN